MSHQTSFPAYGDMSYAAATPTANAPLPGDYFAQAYAAAPYAPAPTAGYGQGPPVAAAATAPSISAGSDDIRTLFVTGFPNNVRERELNNLMRFLPGYEASQMHWKHGQAQGFALFESGAAARMALESIHNLVFDDTVVLRCELARKNMYIKDDSAAKRSRFDAPPVPQQAVPGAAFYGGVPVAGGYFPPAAPPAAPRAYLPVSNARDNPPCNTLFIGNLGDTTSESELRALLGAHPGFKQLKITRGGKSVTAFAEFVDIATAMHVHQTQQGAILATSDRGGIRIQFSKNPFGRKRDYNGNYIDDGAPGGRGNGSAGGGGSPQGGGEQHLGPGDAAARLPAAV